MERILVRLAENACEKQHRHAAIVLRGGCIIARGYNHDRYHAEVAALGSLWPSERRGTRVVTLRVRRDNGKVGMAKPCENCMRYMRANGVKSIVYSDRDGSLQTIKL